MNHNQPSSTMQAVCAARVDHSDELGVDIIAESVLDQLSEARKFRDQLDQYSNGMFSRTVLVRSHYFSDVLRKTQQNYSQLVILGSGLDFRFLNYSGWKEAKTFLIDHPASLKLINSLIIPFKKMLTSVTNIEADFNHINFESFNKKMLDAGFDPNIPTVFLWEGSSYYFEEQTVHKMLSFISRVSSQHILAVDFAKASSWKEAQATTQDSLSSSEIKEALTFLEKKHEPWIGYFEETEIKNFLISQNYPIVDILWDYVLEEKYLKNILMEKYSMFYVEARKKY